MKMMNIPYNNYKTQLCNFWEKGGKCKFGKNCSYAHGEHELRKPYEALPLDAQQSNDQNDVPNDDQKNYDQVAPTTHSPLKPMDGVPCTKTGREAGLAEKTASSRLRILMNNQDQNSCNKMLQANQYLQLGKQEEAYDIIQQLLNTEAISFEYDQPADNSQAVGGSTAPNT